VQEAMMKPLLSVMAIALLVLSVPAQKAEPCKDLKYENKNQVNPNPLSVSTVSGRVIVEVGELGGSAREIGPVTEACLGLFAEKDHQLLATAVVDDEGRFVFDAVPSGKYRLVVRAGPLCVANVPLRVTSRKRRKEGDDKQVVVHMRAAGIDTCSYADYK
jgi:hypothetical protein